MKVLNILFSSVSLVLLLNFQVLAQDYDSINTKDFYNTDIETRRRIIESNIKDLLIEENNINYEIQELNQEEQITNPQKIREFIISHNPKIHPSLVDKIIINVNKYSQENNIDPKLVIALMAKESSFRTSVISSSGAIGLGQLKRGTALEVGITNPFNPIENIKGTARYLSKLSKIFNGDINKTLASYYMGPNALKKNLEAGKKLPPQVNKYVNKIKFFHGNI
ncbi:MAG: lytic transglycosylase domain-containing protein [Candidatus Sericytochromatia bacterium]